MYLSIIIIPFLSFLGCILLGRKIGENGSRIFSCFMLFNSLIISLLLFKDIVKSNNLSYIYLADWFNSGLFSCKFSFEFDLIVSSMLILVLSVSFLVHLFSTSYMNGDPHLPRFMAYLSLFTFFMIILITSGNMIQLFIGWEGVGLCSYLLINFWYTRIQANKAAIKAMIVNKLGDVSLLLSMILIWNLFGSWEYNALFSENIVIDNENILILSTFLLLIGVIGKSAQIGLHMWLPDAMEGPTPVSALIHAATMVTAGVFLIIRLSPLFEKTPSILILVVLIGSFTAFFSSTIGLTQNDFKKVIAYSTCSQLGYMVLICGFSQYSLGLFHLINHGFFKALLFLSAGSIIHAILDEQDLRKAGSMINITPFTYISMVIGSLSLMGLPFLTGFYSKDLIIEMSYGSQILSFGLWLAILSASITAFYSLRLTHFTFMSDYQSHFRSIKLSHEGDLKLLLPLFILVIFSLGVGYTLQWYILKDQIPIVLPNLIKFSALTVSISGALVAILMGILSRTYFWIIKNKFFHIFYTFTNTAWYFDKIVTFYISLPIMNFGFNISYKLIDNQILEGLGPNWVSNYFVKIGSTTSKYHRGYIYSYIFLFIVFIACFIIQI